jgi:hypothetical protein
MGKRSALVAGALVVVALGLGFLGGWFAHQPSASAPVVQVRIVKSNLGANGTLSFDDQSVDGTWFLHCSPQMTCLTSPPPQTLGVSLQVPPGSAISFSTVGFPVGKVLLNDGTGSPYRGAPVPVVDGTRTLEDAGTYTLIVTRAGANYTSIHFSLRVVSPCPCYAAEGPS